MDLGGYIGESIAAFRERGLREGTQFAARDFLFGIYHNLPITVGTPIFEREWDVLIILDACRPDLMEEVSSEYDFLPSEIPSTYSVASASAPWMEKNFGGKYTDQLRETAYITGNPYSDTYCTNLDWGLLDEVWRYAWDDDVGSIPAKAITDRAVKVQREHDFDRLLVHYMQPHFPSFPDPLGSGIDLETFGREWSNVWEQLKRGETSRKEVWSSYRANLRYVLDSVEILLRNLEATSVILSADHGNAFGELGLYGHPINKPAPVLRKVPWIRVEAEDSQSYVPEENANTTDSSSDVNQRLQDLGYLE